jgi:type IV pilus assembly protein PilX
MNFAKTIQNQQGAVLITSVMLILLLTLFGLGAMQSTTLQERMAGNMQQRDLAFQAAEAGLRDAESYIGGLALLPAFNNTGGLYTPVTDGTTPRWDLVDWDAATPNFFTYQAGDLGATPPYPLPRYIIEYIASIEDEADDSVAYGASGTKSDMLRITSRSVSPNGRSVLRLQTTYLR